jgi:tetratricopeptide (TPR) repeat protein
MPYVLNGIGTWHWGKTNVFVRRDRCEFCGSHGPLRSYDTSNFFVVLFIPVIPLGRKRVISHCPRCNRFRVSSLSRWEKQKTDTLLALLTEWRQDQRNSDKACRALAATVLYQDVRAFDDIAEPIVQANGHDPHVLGLLAEAYEVFGRSDQAERALRDALANATPEQADDPGNELAGFLVRANRPAEAEPLLRHILERRHRSGAPVLLGLAAAYVEAGQNEQARRLIDELGTAFPDLLSDQEFEDLRKAAARKGGKLRPAETALGPQRDRVGSRNGPKLVATAVIAVVLALYMTIAISRGRDRQVFLVNGLDQPYEVRVNGQVHTLSPGKAEPIRLAEGELSVAVTDVSLGIEPQTLQIHTPLLTRPFKRSLFVLNPDRTAALMWEETVYAVSHATDAEYPHAFHVGESLYSFDGIDYAFVEAPDEITLPSESSVVRKHRLSLYSGPSPSYAFTTLKEQVGEGAARDWVRRRAARALDNPVMLGTLAGALGPDETIEYLRPRLSDRPVHVDAHRLYQHLVEQSRPDHDLVGEYRRLLAAEPGNTTLIYLLARVLDDRDEALRLFVQASDGQLPCAHASCALAVAALQDAEFDQGLTHIRRALVIDPDNEMFGQLELTALEAAGQYMVCLERIRRKQTKDPHLGLVAEEVYMLARAGQTEAARKRVEEWARGEHLPPQQLAMARQVLMASIHYAVGDVEQYCRALEQAAAVRLDGQPSKPGGAPPLALIARGRLDEAEAAFISAEQTGASEHLTLYIGARKVGRGDLAERCMQRAIAIYGRGTHGERQLAEALATGAVPDDRILYEVAWDTLERCILMTALGLRYPEEREQFFAMARRHNVVKRFPAHLLDEVLKPPT